MRRLVAALLVIGGLVAVFTAFYLDVVAAMFMTLGAVGFTYGLAGYDIDSQKPSRDLSDW